MKPAHAYPESLLRQRRLVNERLSHKIAATFTDDFLASEIRKCVLPGRKVRSILFLNTLQALNGDPDSSSAIDVIFAIELSHAASVLVDDVLDADHFRHGSVATEAEWGSAKSVLFAHLICAIAIQSLAGDLRIQRNLVEVYRSMCVGEMYDVLLRPGNWIYGGYSAQNFQKTVPLFRFTLSTAQYLAGPDYAHLGLETVGEQFGILYQMANDFHDWQPTGLTKRHVTSQTWPITFSFPLSVYLARYQQTRIEKYMERRVLTFDQWMDFVSVIWRPDVREECVNALLAVRCKLSEMISTGGYPNSLKEFYTELVSLISTEEFWYHAYDMS